MRKPVTDWNKFREGFVRETLRRASFRWPPRGEAVRLARTTRKPNPATGKLCWHVRCAICGKEMLEREGRVDHVEPVVPVSSMQQSPGNQGTGGSSLNLGSYVLRMFPEVSGFQVVCSECHDIKTRSENDARRISRKAGGKG